MRKGVSKKYTKQLNERYVDTCEEYLRAFCENYDIKYEQDAWVAGDVGTIACVNDYFFDFHDVIKYAVDNELTDWDEVVEWYDYTLFASEYQQTIPNFKSWHKGCPRLSKEAQQTLVKLKKDFEDTVELYKHQTKTF